MVGLNYVYLDFGYLPTGSDCRWDLFVSMCSHCDKLANGPVFVHAFISSCQVFAVGLFSRLSQSTMTWLQLRQGAAARQLTNTLSGPESPRGPRLIGPQWNTYLILKSFFVSFKSNMGVLILKGATHNAFPPRGYLYCKKGNNSSHPSCVFFVEIQHAPVMLNSLFTGCCWRWKHELLPIITPNSILLHYTFVLHTPLCFQHWVW